MGDGEIETSCGAGANDVLYASKKKGIPNACHVPLRQICVDARQCNHASVVEHAGRFWQGFAKVWTRNRGAFRGTFRRHILDAHSGPCSARPRARRQEDDSCPERAVADFPKGKDKRGKGQQERSKRESQKGKVQKGRSKREGPLEKPWLLGRAFVRELWLVSVLVRVWVKGAAAACRQVRTSNVAVICGRQALLQGFGPG